MLTHADDYRVMTVEDMDVVKELSTADGGLGNSQQEARFLACMRLLLGHIECRTEEVLDATEKGRQECIKVAEGYLYRDAAVFTIICDIRALKNKVQA